MGILPMSRGTPGLFQTEISAHRLTRPRPVLPVISIRVKRNGLIKPPSSASPKGAGVSVEFAGHAHFPRETFSLHPSGIQLKTRWYLDTGTEVALGLQTNGHRLDVEGLVVACHPCPGAVSAYDTTVYFPSLTAVQQRKLAALAASVTA
jgi:hypothetical protein